jgi:arylsulfatase A
VQDELDVRWEWAFAGGERPDRDLDALESLYDGGIRQADAVVERVVERLRERGTLDETLLVVCADHGEAFGERGRLDGEPRRLAHIVPMGEELLHVPLVVRPPGGGDGDRVDAPASLARLPEVARGHVAGDPPTRGFAAGTVRATKQPVTADLRARYEAARGRAAPYLAPSHAVYEAADGAVRKRYHWGDAAGAFLVPEAGVVERAGGADADAVAGAFDAPDAGVAEPLPESSVTAETEERLAALGYH